MTIAYRRRKKAIKIEKRKLKWSSFIEPKDFAYLQANWQRQVNGPPIGTLEQLVGVQHD